MSRRLHDTAAFRLQQHAEGVRSFDWWVTSFGWAKMARGNIRGNHSRGFGQFALLIHRDYLRRMSHVWPTPIAARWCPAPHVSVGLTVTAFVVAGCASTPRVVAPPAMPTVAADELSVPPSFPSIPRADGKLDLRIVYPPEGATIVARDSTFLFGAVGNGDAQLRVNGTEVRVLPNGAWLAWLPLPPRERPVWLLVASRGADTVRATRRIVLPAGRPLLADEGPLVVDSASLRPGPREARLSHDAVRLSLRAPRTSTVVFVAPDGSRRPLRNNAELGEGTGDPTLWATDVEAQALQLPGRLEIARGADTIALAINRVALMDSSGARYAVVGDRTPAAVPGSPAPSTLAAAPDSERVIVARPVATNGTYKWFLLPGTVVEVTGRSGNMVRARLDRDLDVWLDTGDVRELPVGTPAPVRIAGNARVVDRGEWSELVIPIGARPAYAVQETNDGIELELYGTVANTDIINVASRDSVVRRVTWAQLTRDRARYTVALNAPLFGYAVRWERGALVLRLRRAPVVRPARPLSGLIIAVDAGHPPAGSTGPTGLYEAVATLAIAQQLKAILEGRGATVYMTRVAAGAVPLGDRPELARRAGAHAFVSIHLNAVPDGVNPLTAHGTGTYYFSPRSVSLARSVQQGMVRRMGLRDLGINYDNLAVLRPTWMPSILCEGAFVIVPEQEALLRMPEFQQAYALGVADGVEGYFRGVTR